MRMPRTVAFRDHAVNDTPRPARVTGRAAFFSGRPGSNRGDGLSLGDGARAELHAEVTIYDPVASAQLRAMRPVVRLARSAMSAARAADVAIIATEWPEFATLDLRALRRTMRGTLLVEARGLFDVTAAHLAGLDYFSFSTAGVRPCAIEERLPAVAS